MQPGDLHGQHRGRVFHGHQFGVPGGQVAIPQDQHAYRGAAEDGHRDQALSLPDRAAHGHRPLQEPVPLIRVGLGVGIGAVRARPRHQVAEAVLDGRRAIGQLVDRLGDPLLPVAPERHLGQPVVDLHAAPQREVGHAQLLGLFSLPAVQARVGQRHPRLLGQDLEQEPLNLRGRALGADHQVAGRPVGAGQRVGPRPRHAGQRDRSVCRAAVRHLDDVRQAGRRPAGEPHVLPSAVEEDPFRGARPQGLDRIGDVGQDAGLAALLGQEHREHEHAPERGELFAGRTVMVRRVRHYLLPCPAGTYPDRCSRGCRAPPRRPAPWRGSAACPSGPRPPTAAGRTGTR